MRYIMTMTNKIKEIFSHELLLAYMIGLVFTFETLNFIRFYPSLRGLDLGLQALIVLAVSGMLVILNPKLTFHKVGLSFWGWSYFVLILWLQPFLIETIYPDVNFLSIASIVFLMVISLIIYQVKDKQNFVKILAKFILLAAFFQTLTLWAHLLRLDFLYHKLIYPIASGANPIGNIAQPNQAAFILSIGIAATLYLSELFIVKKNKFIFLYSMMAYLSIGIALTASRGGILLAVAAIVGYGLFVNKSVKQRAMMIISQLSIFFFGNLLGIWTLKYFSSNNRTIVDRVADKGISIRWYQIEQSWIVFKEHPVFGIGWEQFITSATLYRDKIQWVSVADHTHFIPSQIAAELGIIGLIVFIPFAWIGIKAVNFRASIQNAYLLTTLLIFVAYSLSEYPLWYFYYLLIFAVFVALIDKNYTAIRIDSILIKKAVMVFLSLSCMLGVYYYSAYNKYANALGAVTSNQLTWQDKVEIVNNLPKPYGFLEYKENLLFEALPVSSQQLEEKIALGKRVILRHPEPQKLMKLGLLYGVLGDKQTSLEQFKTACMFEFGQYCKDATETLYSATEQQPTYYQDIYDGLLSWKSKTNR